MKKQKKVKKKIQKKQTDRPECGLCGKKTKVIKTECCEQWICDDENQYVLFSYARNSCHRNHRRFTLCGYHYAEDHDSDWQTCSQCREAFETEMYVYRGTNEYNFERLPNPPGYEPTKCSKCNIVINLGKDAFSRKAGKYLCSQCTDFKLP